MYEGKGEGRKGEEGRKEWGREGGRERESCTIGRVYPHYSQAPNILMGLENPLIGPENLKHHCATSQFFPNLPPPPLHQTLHLNFGLKPNFSILSLQPRLPAWDE